MKLARLALFFAAAPGWAAYSYYLTDNLSAVDPVKWFAAGTLAPGSAGLAAADPAGGSLISRLPVPDGTAEAEVRITIRLASSGGTYTEFLQATSDARTSGTGAGTYLAFEMQNPQLDSNGHCSANFVLLESAAGVTALLSAFQHSCRDGMEMRLALHGAVALLWPDTATPMEVPVTAPGTGFPGIGAYATPAGNAISEVQLGLIDRVAPPAIDKQHIGASAFRNRIDVQWQPVTDEPPGRGLSTYWVSRDGQYFLRTTATIFQDMTVKPGETHTYTITAVDQHDNFSPPVSVVLSTPVPQPGSAPVLGIPPHPSQPRRTSDSLRPSPLQVTAGTPPADSGNGMDPRRVGVRALGSYWGAAGEQIDTTSGNLNVSFPLMKVLSRGGWSVTFRLSYNSQMWRQDSGGTWLMGYDVGYGLGWILQAGSVVPVWTNTSQIDHYLYVDSTGAEYSLSVNTGGVWTSQEGIYLSYDSNANRLYFNDGSFWVMGSQSASGEQDAGTLYPTLMEDSNGNQILIVYGVGAGAGTANTSARLSSIQDPREPYVNQSSYQFSYTSGHLTAVSNFVGTPEAYSISYASSQPLNSPFSGASYGTTTLLQSISPLYAPISTSFQYNPGGSGEMTQMTTQLGGVLQWQNRTFTYAGSVSLREVQSRSLNSGSGLMNSWSFTHPDSTDASLTYHSWTNIRDNGTTTQKIYWQSALSLTVPTVATTQYEEVNADGSASQYKSYWFGYDSAGNSYRGGMYTTLYGGGTTSQKSEWIYPDVYGNTIQYIVYDWGNPNSPKWTYNYTYLTDPNYTSRYIRNRLTQATVTINGVTTQLAFNTYDRGVSIDRPGLPLHDSNYSATFNYRGDLSSTRPDNHSYQYDSEGVVISVGDGLNRSVSYTPTSSTSYSLPNTLTPGGNTNLATTVSYATSWAVTQVVDSNGATSKTSYDSYGRPASTTLADGVVTNYAYTYNPNTQTATITNPPENPGGTKWKRTTLDGFGRVIKVEAGHDTTTVSTVDTQYAPCACSPLGKLYRVSQPYAPGGTEVWTTYAYDGSGRTLTVTAPDGSVTHYSYAGNQTTVTDPAGKWKTQTKDALGNLTAVTEPNPSGGANFVTAYSYDGFNHLTNVTLTRPEGTQTRTFNYNNGPDLITATNPENGTVTYTYDNAHEVVTRTDAKQQKTQYTYDGYGRLSEVQHFYPPSFCGNNCEDVNQRWTYYYDSPVDPNYGATNTWGRLTATTFGGGPNFMYEYSYNIAGRVIAQRMEVDNFVANPVVLDATYAWDNEGRLTSEVYPSGTTLTYGFDLMGRLNKMTQDGTQQATATYGPANELTNLSYYGYSETRTYNSLLQLTRQTVPGVFDMEYVFPTGQNNGQISSSIDHITGQQVNYTYDPLKRLTAAATVGPQWGQAYTYDGFGNMTSSSVTQGSGVNWSNAANPANNHMVSWNYDANGNWDRGWSTTTYDNENRLVSGWVNNSGCPASWSYDPSNKRVLAQNPCVNNGDTDLSFYDIFGKRIMTFDCVAGQYCATPGSPDVYFGNKLIQSNGVTVVTDRLGSVRANSSGQRFEFLPYGEELTSTPDNGVKFGTYFRDSTGFTSQDYADQRYYNFWFGRFNTPDPSARRAVNPRNPATWNKYAYVKGDPVNANDPSGLCAAMIAGITMSNGNSQAFDNERAALGANAAYPYAGMNGLASVGSVVSQALLGPNASTAAASAALRNALDNNTGSIDVIAYSGGAQAFSTAISQLSAADQARIGNILYISPGMAGTIATPNGYSNVTVVLGADSNDVAATVGTTIPIGVRTIHSTCDHTDIACLLRWSPLNQITADGACNDAGIYERGSGASSGPASVPAPMFVGDEFSGGPGYLFLDLNSNGSSAGSTDDVTSTITYQL